MASNMFNGASAEVKSQQRGARDVKRKRFDGKSVESTLNPAPSPTMVLRPQNQSSSSTGGSTEVDNFMSPSSETIIANSTSINQLRKVNLSKASVSSSSSNPFLSVPSPSKAPSSSNRNGSEKQDNSKKKCRQWETTDDLTLIERMIQTNDPHKVYIGVKFSRKFTLKEITERWYVLLYDPIINRDSLSAIRNLHPTVKARIESKALFSTDEEDILSSIHSNMEPTIETFQDLLDKNPKIFHLKRTAKVLYLHWGLMKKYSLLSDQRKTFENLPNYSDLEDLLNIDEEQLFQHNPVFDQDLNLALNNIQSALDDFEEESPPDKLPQDQSSLDQLPQDHVLALPMTDADPVEFDEQTLAVLQGRMVRYLVKAREILIGRSSKYQQVDIDLKLEGPVSKISRRQATIRLCNSGHFIVVSQGKKCLFVDGKPVVYSKRTRLNHNSVLEIAGLKFVFLINHQLVDPFKQEYYLQKMPQQSVQMVNQIPPQNRADTTVQNDKRQQQKLEFAELKRGILDEHRKIAQKRQEMFDLQRKLMEFEEKHFDF